jgi:hypothetical protein
MMNSTHMPRLAAAVVGFLVFSAGLRARAEPVSVHYAIPGDAPTGEVQVMFFGLADFEVMGPGQPQRFLHLRLAAHNQRDSGGWTLDAREQGLVLPGSHRILPLRGQPLAFGALISPMIASTNAG